MRAAKLWRFLKGSWSHREQYLWRPAQEEGINPLSAGGEAGKPVPNKWDCMCLKALTAIIFSTACFTPAQGPWAHCPRGVHRGFAVSAEGRVWSTGLQGQKVQQGASLVSLLLQAGAPLSYTALLPCQGLLSEAASDCGFQALAWLLQTLFLKQTGLLLCHLFVQMGSKVLSFLTTFFSLCFIPIS